MRAALDFLSRWQYPGLFVLIFAEEAGIPLPIPGDLFIAAMGVLAHSGRSGFLATAAVVTTATVLGSALLYSLARHAGRPLLLRVARRFGYTDERSARVEAWLMRRGAVGIVAGRLTPGLRIVMTVVAGVLRLDRGTFAAGTLAGGVIWATLYFWLGYFAGAGIEALPVELTATDDGLLAAGGALLAALVFSFLRRRRLLSRIEGP